MMRENSRKRLTTTGFVHLQRPRHSGAVVVNELDSAGADNRTPAISSVFRSRLPMRSPAVHKNRKLHGRAVAAGPHPPSAIAHDGVEWWWRVSITRIPRERIFVKISR